MANPNLSRQNLFETTDHTNANRRVWSIYVCGRCGGVVTAASTNPDAEVLEVFPMGEVVDELIPERPKAYLQQALESIHAPAGAVMLAASAVDAMLKAKEYIDGSLYHRIDKAKNANLITEDMAKWAHEVRLDANEQRHADAATDLPTQDDAVRIINFATALGEILFVLPQRVQRGIQDASQDG